MENSKLIEAAREFISLKNRNTHPAGSFDSAGRWYPARRLACCDSIRDPSRSYPLSYMVHCRSAGHVAALRGVDVSELRSVAIRAEKSGLDPVAVVAADEARDLAKKMAAAMKKSIQAGERKSQPARSRSQGL